MFDKKFFILAIFLIALLSISVVSADDSADAIVLEDSDSDIVLNEENTDSELSSSDSTPEELSVEDTADVDLEAADINNVKEDNVVSSDVNNEDDAVDDITLSSKTKNTLKASYADYPTSVYITPVTTYYVSGKYLYFGWEGYFSGYFRVYHGSSCVHSEYLSGYNGDRQWSTDNLDVGTYTAKLIDNYYGLLDSAKIVINKATTRIKVNSFTTRAGIKFHCYAYVKDKNDGTNINGGIVKFRIAGKTYKAKLKNGVASFYFKVPKKVRKYTCKAYYLGGGNVKASSTKFTMRVKKPIKYKVLSIKTKLNKYVSKRYGKYKAQTYAFKNPYMKTVCIYLYKSGKMVSGTKYLSRVHYKYRGKWYWSKWRSSYGEAVYHRNAGIDPKVKIGKVQVKFRIS